MNAIDSATCPASLPIALCTRRQRDACGDQPLNCRNGFFRREQCHALQRIGIAQYGNRRVGIGIG
jgi:hypothetical protein